MDIAQVNTRNIRVVFLDKSHKHSQITQIIIEDVTVIISDIKPELHQEFCRINDILSCLLVEIEKSFLWNNSIDSGTQCIGITREVSGYLISPFENREGETSQLIVIFLQSCVRCIIRFIEWIEEIVDRE